MEGRDDADLVRRAPPGHRAAAALGRSYPCWCSPPMNVPGSLPFPKPRLARHEVRRRHYHDSLTAAPVVAPRTSHVVCPSSPVLSTPAGTTESGTARAANEAETGLDIHMEQ